jgi:hypothetical protein
MPRVVLVLVWLFTGFLGKAYTSVIWPVLGFLFMPLTTLAYAWAKNSSGSVEGYYLAVVVIAALIDLGTLGGGGAKGSRYGSVNRPRIGA